MDKEHTCEWQLQQFWDQVSMASFQHLRLLMTEGDIPLPHIAIIPFCLDPPDSEQYYKKESLDPASSCNTLGNHSAHSHAPERSN